MPPPPLFNGNRVGQNRCVWSHAGVDEVQFVGR
jgi:hypothetical protein